jgi:hypothetical protein
LAFQRQILLDRRATLAKTKNVTRLCDKQGASDVGAVRGRLVSLSGAAFCDVVIHFSFAFIYAVHNSRFGCL